MHFFKTYIIFRLFCRIHTHFVVILFLLDDNYLLFANHIVISRVNLDGSSLGVVLGVESGGAVGIQFDLA